MDMTKYRDSKLAKDRAVYRAILTDLIADGKMLLVDSPNKQKLQDNISRLESELRNLL